MARSVLIERRVRCAEHRRLVRRQFINKNRNPVDRITRFLDKKRRDALRASKYMSEKPNMRRAII